MIYHDHLNDGREKGWAETKIISINIINTFSNSEQGQVVDIFRPNSMSCTITPTISSLGGIVACMVPKPNSPIATNSFFLKK